MYAEKTLGVVFLYPWQQLVIANVLDGFLSVQARDRAENPDADFVCAARQIVLLPTGAGKSLCFQAAAGALPGATLAIYPLLALMNDQARALKQKGVEPVILRGGLSPQEFADAERAIKKGARFIIANPEILLSRKVGALLKETEISHIVVDEAHCVSEWGDSFRPAYKEIGSVIKELRAPVVTAFTATASPAVLERINSLLFDGAARVIRGSADRENIRYIVRRAVARTPALLAEALAREKPMVIFCSTRRGTEKLAQTLLAASICGENVRFYHAGLTRAEKIKTERWFAEQTDGILTATCAWGMGVDKKNVRTVIHFEPPQTAESYVQESGRAGRDGERAEAVLLWTPEDSAAASRFPEGSRSRVLYDFARGTECRRSVLLRALSGERAPRKSETEKTAREPTSEASSEVGFVEEPKETACAGCDVCDKTVYEYTDELVAEQFIKANKRRFTFREAAAELVKAANRASQERWNKRLWTPDDAAEILRYLLRNKRVHATRFYPAKGRLTARRSRS